jgi:hypothetical protein
VHGLGFSGRFRILNRHIFILWGEPLLRSGQFGGQKVLAPSENPLIADYVFCPHKKITSRTIRNSGAVIVSFELVLNDLGMFRSLSLFSGSRQQRRMTFLGFDSLYMSSVYRCIKQQLFSHRLLIYKDIFLRNASSSWVCPFIFTLYTFENLRWESIRNKCVHFHRYGQTP